MAATGYTPISLFYSTTAAAAPLNTSLVNGELAINITDGKLYYKDNSGVVQTIASKDANSGTFTNATVSGNLTLSGGTANGVLYLNGSKVATSGSALVFDGTNLGIGTSSPGLKLDVNGAARLLAGNALYFQNASANANGTIVASGGSGDNSLSFNSGALLLNASGNLGLGVTPSAWANSKAIDVGGFGALSTDTLNDANTSLSWNAYATAYNAWKYKNTGSAASRYAQEAGKHYWYTAPSGTAGNAITFTQAMTLDESGTLLIATTTSPTTGGFSRPPISIKQLNDTGYGSGIQIEAYADQSVLGIGYNGTTFQIGTSYRGTGAYKGISFAPGDTERARITSGGYFKASNDGTYLSSTGTYHELRQSITDNIFEFTNTNSTTPYGGAITFTGATPNNTTSHFLYCADSTNAKCIIYSSGTIQNRTGTYTTISDLKLKQDIVDASSQWDDIKALRIVKYRLKDEVAADPDYPSYIGLIAQEVEEISPGLVDNCPDFETNEDGERVATGTSTKSVKTSILYMKAVKALQEAMERIETLEAEVAALKSN